LTLPLELQSAGDLLTFFVAEQFGISGLENVLLVVMGLFVQGFCVLSVPSLLLASHYSWLLKQSGLTVGLSKQEVL